MPLSYHHFYIGDNLLSESDFSQDPPRLLVFSKVQSDLISGTEPHLHSHLEIFYFESGHGVFQCGDQRIPLKAHDLIVANARSIHMQYSDDLKDPLIYYNFAVDRLQIAGNAANAISGHDFEHFSFETADNPFYQTVQAILAEYTGKQYSYYSKINALFTDFLIETIRLFRKKETVEHPERTGNTQNLLRVKQYIDEHYAENLNLDLLTRHSFLQKSYFLHSFKKQFGISPMKYLNRVRMEHAKLLLLRSDSSITEIAREVGFNNPTYFSEMFLKTVGMSPSAYRKLITTDL